MCAHPLRPPALRCTHLRGGSGRHHRPWLAPEELTACDAGRGGACGVVSWRLLGRGEGAQLSPAPLCRCARPRRVQNNSEGPDPARGAPRASAAAVRGANLVLLHCWTIGAARGRAQLPGGRHQCGEGPIGRRLSRDASPFHMLRCPPSGLGPAPLSKQPHQERRDAQRSCLRRSVRVPRPWIGRGAADHLLQRQWGQSFDDSCVAKEGGSNQKQAGKRGRHGRQRRGRKARAAHRAARAARCSPPHHADRGPGRAQRRTTALWQWRSVHCASEWPQAGKWPGQLRSFLAVVKGGRLTILAVSNTQSGAAFCDYIGMLHRRSCDHANTPIPACRLHLPHECERPRNRLQLPPRRAAAARRREAHRFIVALSRGAGVSSE